MTCLKGWEAGCLNESERAKHFDNPDGYTGLRGIPKRNSLQAILDSQAPVLVDAGMKKIKHLIPNG